MHVRHARMAAVVVGVFIALAMVIPVAAVNSDHFRGRLVEFHGDDFTIGRTTLAGYALETTRGNYRLSLRDANLARYVGQQVELSGTRSGRDINVTGYQAVSASSESVASTTTASTKNVAVLLFNFRNDTRQPWTPETVNGVMFTNGNSVANYFAEQSYGQMAMTGAVFGWYTIDYDNTGCSYSAWATAAKSAATTAGVSLSSFTNVVYAFPSASGCGWSGVAYMPGTKVWVNGAMGLRVPAHELSHNFGVHHAASVNCVVAGVRVSLSANAADCTLNEYGDPFTVMGAASTRQSHAMHKAQLGWLSGAEPLDVTAPGSYTLAAQESAPANPKLIRVTRAGASNQYFYLELRQPYGSFFDNFSSIDPAVTGVTVRVAPDYATRTQSWLVDTAPSTASYGDAPLAVGRTFTDPLSSVTITTQSVSAGSATVYIAFSPDTTAPTPPASVTATTVGASSVALGWAPASDDRFVAGYRVSRDGSLVATTTSMSWTDSGLTPDTAYIYSVVAYDGAGNVSDATIAPASTGSVADTQAPTAPTNLVATATGTDIVSLGWSSSTDDHGVAGYRVSRNGTLVATTTATSWTDSGLSAATKYNYSVVAFDAAGNASAAATASATTNQAADTQPPTTPVSLAATGVGTDWAALGWSASTDDRGVAGYRVARNGTVVATTTATAWTDTGLAPSTDYDYTVVAFDAAGNVSSPAMAAVRTNQLPDTTPPTAPTNVAATVLGTTSVAVSWTASTDDRGVAGYRVSRNGTLVATTTTTSWTDSGLTAGSRYDYTVVAFDAAGNVSPSAAASATTSSQPPDTQAPSAPTTLAGSVNKNGITSLTWKTASDNVGVAGYRVYRNGSLFATTTSTSFSAKKVRGTFSYYVVAFDAAGNLSSASNTVTVTVR
jgi:chitodextrinase